MGKDGKPFLSFKAEVEGRNVQKIRLTNITGQEQKVYFKQFGFEEK